MRIGVYNQFWSTIGGGEQYAGGIAQALAGTHEVTLLTPRRQPIDADLLLERLSVDVRGLAVREVPADGRCVSVASLDYDAFINVSFSSSAHNLAPAGLYVAHFPTESFSIRQRAAVVARSFVGRIEDPVLRYVGGMARRRGGPNGGIVGPVLLEVSTSRPAELEFVLSVRESGARRVRVAVGRTIVEDRFIVGESRIAVGVPPGVAVPVFVVIEGAMEIESAADAMSHRRESGTSRAEQSNPRFVLANFTLDGRRIDPLASSLRGRLAPVRPTAFVDSYDLVVANSGFTAEWISRRWRRDCSVLHPPVRMRAGGTKERVIVSVGRFFGEHAGHSKRQLEMVRAFRRLVARGFDDWRLVLIGGCDAAHRDYAIAVKREAIGLPVDVRFNAPGYVLDDALAHASIYWHATGLGVDAERHPDDVEHFGIAPIEAMSAGAVPVVYGVGGPAEVVQDGISGVHFRTLDELVDRTAELIAAPAWLGELRTAAIARSRAFSHERFQAETVKLVEEVAEGARPGRASARQYQPANLGVAERVQRWSDPRRRAWSSRGRRTGGAVRCNICGWRGVAFEGEAHSEFAVCPSCGSIARDRFLFHCYVERTPYRRDLRLLETSPRLGDGYKRFMAGWCQYISSDFMQSAHPGAVCLDLQAIGLRTASIDVVLTPHVLEHVPDTDAALAELYRVVAPGGVVYLQVPVQQPVTSPPPEPEYHGDNTFVYWRFGFDLTERLRKVGFTTALLTTEDFARRARSGEPWGAGAGFPDDLLTGVDADDIVVVADDDESLYRGFHPSFWFLTWECRRP